MKNKNIKGTLIVFSIVFVFCINALSQIKVTLLGTGGPVPSIERFSASTLIEAGGDYFLFDCGRGASQRLWQLKIPLSKIKALFLTHLHSDHVVGIPDVWLTGLLPGAFGNRRTPFEVWGPAGTTEMMQGVKAAFSWDIKTRIAEYSKADSGAMLSTHNITEGIVYEKEGIKITAFLVNHSNIIDSALGYRLDYGGHSVVISGDTRYCENLIKYAQGVDVLIHEVIGVGEEMLQKSAIARQIADYHTTPELAGKVFSLTRPKLAVFSHIVLPAIEPSLPPLTIDNIILQTRKNYSGLLEAGEDLMSIEISDSVKVFKYSGKENRQK